MAQPCNVLIPSRLGKIELESDLQATAIDSGHAYNNTTKNSNARSFSSLRRVSHAKCGRKIFFEFPATVEDECSLTSVLNNLNEFTFTLNPITLARPSIDLTSALMQYTGSVSVKKLYPSSETQRDGKQSKQQCGEDRPKRRSCAKSVGAKNGVICGPHSVIVVGPQASGRGGLYVGSGTCAASMLTPSKSSASIRP